MSCTSVPADYQNLSQLIDRLASGLPHSNSMRVLAKRVRAGELIAHFYTDGWPDFTIVVCHRLSPGTSEGGDIIAVAHSACKKRLLQVIQESGIVRWKAQQIFCAGFEVACADHIVRNLKPPPGNEDVSIQCYQATRYYLPLGALEGPERTCPDGFFLGKLLPQHTVLVADHWPYTEVKGRLSTLADFETLIRKFHSVAVFQTSNPEKPVGWVLQWAHGELANLYVLQEFRGKGLSLLCLREICQCITDGDIPEALIVNDNHIAHSVFKKAGFIEMQQETLFLISVTPVESTGAQLS